MTLTTQQSLTTEKLLAKVKAYCNKIGFDHYIIGLVADSLVSFHFENIPIAGAFKIMINGFSTVIGMEIERNPHYSPQLKKVYQDLDTEFRALIKKYDEKIKKTNLKQS